MTIKTTIIILALGVGALVSCKKKEDPAPAAPVVTATGSGTFTVNGAVQTPNVFTKNVYNTPNTFTQVSTQNTKYNIKMEFQNGTLKSGNYDISNAFPPNEMDVIITLTDLSASGKVYMTSNDASVKVKVADKKITLPTITIADGVTISADITLP